MSKKKPVVTEANNFIERLDPTIRESFSQTQINGIREAFQEPKRKRRHGVDLRGVVPLFFARFYFVFLAGRDRRYTDREGERRRKAAVAWGVLLFLMSMSPLILIVLVVLIILQSVFGVDLFPGSSFLNFFKF